jgi:hypothetical protein
VFCDSPDSTCRQYHLADPLDLDPNPRSPGDGEGSCPECGHGGFALSAPTRSRSLRHIWSCNCKRCNRGKGCPAGTIRIALLRRGIGVGCLGIYDGDASQDIQPEAARRLKLAVSDILAAPGLKPADIRIMLAEAEGRKVPEDFTRFVAFAIEAGVGRSQAYEAAARWCRPSDCHPQTRGAVADAES